MPEYSGSAHRLSLYVEQYDSRLTTGKANWLAAEVKSIHYGRVTDPDTMTGAETISVGTGFLDAIPSADAWRKADVVRHPVGTSEYGLHPWDSAPNSWAKRHEAKLREIATCNGKPHSR